MDKNLSKLKEIINKIKFQYNIMDKYLDKLYESIEDKKGGSWEDFGIFTCYTNKCYRFEPPEEVCFENIDEQIKRLDKFFEYYEEEIAKLEEINNSIFFS